MITKMYFALIRHKSIVNDMTTFLISCAIIFNPIIFDLIYVVSLCKYQLLLKCKEIPTTCSLNHGRRKSSQTTSCIVAAITKEEEEKEEKDHTN